MGAKEKNFYNQLAIRYGYASEAAEIQELYLSDRKADAARAVPDDLVRAVSLVGDETSLAQQVAEFERAGVTTLLLNPLASAPDQRIKDIATMSRILESRTPKD
jgi:alkanesulfonate monooxygenase SsuD/methylene tetrahydromethanopterin reductase-like flavin-dependent oxidoreductase (luciferase family)